MKKLLNKAIKMAEDDYQVTTNHLVNYDLNNELYHVSEKKPEHRINNM
jgi:hypothetical protein